MLMQYEPHCFMFDCNHCCSYDKKRDICTKPETIRKIDCYCGGDKDCSLCKGTGQIKLKKCMAEYAKRSDLSYIMRYFYHYRKTNQYPDGKAILEQPALLTMAFNILSLIVCKKEAIQREAAKNGR